MISYSRITKCNTHSNILDLIFNNSILIDSNFRHRFSNFKFIKRTLRFLLHLLILWIKFPILGQKCPSIQGRLMSKIARSPSTICTFNYLGANEDKIQIQGLKEYNDNSLGTPHIFYSNLNVLSFNLGKKVEIIKLYDYSWKHTFYLLILLY